MPVIIIIVVIFLLVNISRSHQSAGPSVTKSIITPPPSSGDNFFSCCTMVAGVCEPITKIPILQSPARRFSGPASGCSVGPVGLKQYSCDAPPVPLHLQYPVDPALPVKTTIARPRVYQGQSGTAYKIFPCGGIGSVNACCSLFSCCGRTV